ncbi:hypothetical protein SAMN05216325_11038 [Nitrosomonas marina]|uniref:Uncharacterized protein n=1 Tax=Nitrosomonas marina TaxID=917 RepID=A0A1H8EMJ1_9PROT|nr:hypothetical protein SAMN05216325_11038 [Nitrosomonas marina]
MKTKALQPFHLWNITCRFFQGFMAKAWMPGAESSTDTGLKKTVVFLSLAFFAIEILAYGLRSKKMPQAR